MKNKLNELLRLKNEVSTFRAKDDNEIENWRENIKKHLINLYQNDDNALQEISKLNDASAFASMYVDDINLPPSTLETRSNAAVSNVIGVIEELISSE